MKHLISNKALAATLALWAAATAPARADIQLTVDVTNKTTSTVAVVYQTTIVEIPLDDNGHGSHTFQGIEGVHANLFYGMNARPIFLEDGDRIHVSFDGSRFKDQVAYEAEGGREKVFNYLNQVKLVAPPEEKLALPFDEFTELVDQKRASAHRILKAWKLQEVSPLFVTTETGRIDFAYNSALIMYAAGHPFVAQDTTYVPDSAYYSEIRRRAVEDERYTGIKEYREYMKEIAHIFGCKRGEARTPYDRTVCMMGYIADNVENEKVKQALLNVLAIEQVEQYGIEGIDEMMNLYSTFVTDTVLQAAFREKYDAWDVVKTGKPSPDFRAWDRDNKDWHVADFRGKYVYIDLWATWCGPCRREIPHLKQLESEFKDRNITFVSLSVDARKADWLKVVESQQMAGVQLFLGTGSKFQTAYKASGIPHFILLDPEGRIVNANMLRPSSPEIRSYLNRLPGM
ncbi:MAG: TlpA family protein disulfide reductase [Clostridium sp.]|nr:TlpA family protein disulfide reductase [Clostridium sp.]